MDLSTVANLGVAGFSVLVMWWMYQSAANERKAADERLDQRDENYRDLEREVRTTITAQLLSSTSALHENSKVMERVLDKLKA
jgi:hypothetical protein